MRKFTTEDRSATDGDTCPQTRIEQQTLQDLEHLTDFTAEEFDHIADMKPGDEYILGGIWVQRTE